MTMLHTIQSSYERIRAEYITVADAALTPATAGLTYKASDRPSDCFEAGPAAGGGMCVIFDGEATDGDTFSWSLYGYRTVAEGGIGPAEIICSGTGIFGTAVSDTGDGYLYVDTIVITNPGSWYDVPVAIDSDSNRICKICFDFAGFKFLSVRFTVIGSTSINGHVAYF